MPYLQWIVTRLETWYRWPVTILNLTMYFENTSKTLWQKFHVERAYPFKVAFYLHRNVLFVKMIFSVILYFSVTLCRKIIKIYMKFIFLHNYSSFVGSIENSPKYILKTVPNTINLSSDLPGNIFGEICRNKMKLSRNRDF